MGLRDRLRPLVAALRSDDRRAVRRAALVLAVALFLVYMANGKRVGTQDSIPAQYLPHSIVHEGDLDFNEFTHLYQDGKPYYLLRRGDTYLSSYPVMPGILAVPVHLAAHLFGGADGPESLEMQEKVAAALIAACSAAFVFLAARQACSGGAALVVALVYALGTTTYSTSSQALWQHGPVELFLAIAAYLLLRGRRGGHLWPVGASLGMAVLCRPSAAPVVAIVAAYILVTRWRQVPLFVLAGLPFLAFGVWCNLDYGTVLGPYHLHYQGKTSEWWSGAFWPTLAGHLVSPSRGLLVFSPVLVFAAHGLWRKVVVERDGAFACFAVVCVAHVAVISKFSMWWAGDSFGPRYATDLMPLAALFLCPMAQRLVGRRRDVASVAFLGLAVVSIAIHSLGVYSSRTRRWNGNPSIDRYPQRVWDWADSQILAAFHKRPTIVPFDSMPTDAGVRVRDPRAAYGWARRLDPSPSPVTLAFHDRVANWWWWTRTNASWPGWRSPRNGATRQDTGRCAPASSCAAAAPGHGSGARSRPLEPRPCGSTTR